MKIKKYFALMLVVAFLSTSASAAGYNAIITNNERSTPAYTNTLITGSDMNNPAEATRYEGLPNAFSGNEGGGGGYGYHYVDDKRGHCTKLTATSAAPYMGHIDNYRTMGKMVIEFDLMRDAGNGTTTVASFGKTAAEVNIGNNLFTINAAMTLTLGAGAVPNATNFPAFQTMTPNQWYHFDLTIDINANTWSLFIDDKEITRNAPPPGAGSLGYYMFRITQRKVAAATDSSVFIDNLYIYFDAGFNYDLLHGSSLTKADSSAAMVRCIPILVDRYDLSVRPYKNGDAIYMPLRFVADTFRAETTYDDATKNIKILYGNRTIELNTQSKNLTVNGETFTLQNYPKVTNGRTFLPVNAITRAFYTNAYYNDDGYILLTDYTGVSEEDFEMLARHMEEVQ